MCCVVLCCVVQRIICSSLTILSSYFLTALLHSFDIYFYICSLIYHLLLFNHFILIF